MGGTPLVCGQCRQCCVGPLRVPVLLNPATELGKYPHVSITGPSGATFHFLATNADTDCIFIGDAGCTIYETRPEGCRNFDCREVVDQPDLPPLIRVEALRRGQPKTEGV